MSATADHVAANALMSVLVRFLLKRILLGLSFAMSVAMPTMHHETGHLFEKCCPDASVQAVVETSVLQLCLKWCCQLYLACISQLAAGHWRITTGWVEDLWIGPSTPLHLTNEWGNKTTPHSLPIPSSPACQLHMVVDAVSKDFPLELASVGPLPGEEDSKSAERQMVQLEVHSSCCLWSILPLLAVTSSEPPGIEPFPMSRWCAIPVRENHQCLLVSHRHGWNLIGVATF